MTQVFPFTGVVEIDARDGHLFIQAGDPALIGGEPGVDPAALDGANWPRFRTELLAALDEGGGGARLDGIARQPQPRTMGRNALMSPKIRMWLENPHVVETTEVDDAEWNAMTDEQRHTMGQDLWLDFMNNHIGGGWEPLADATDDEAGDA